MGLQPAALGYFLDLFQGSNVCSAFFMFSYTFLSSGAVSEEAWKSNARTHACRALPCQALLRLRCKDAVPGGPSRRNSRSAGTSSESATDIALCCGPWCFLPPPLQNHVQKAPCNLLFYDLRPPTVFGRCQDPALLRPQMAAQPHVLILAESIAGQLGGGALLFSCRA